MVNDRPEKKSMEAIRQFKARGVNEIMVRRDGGERHEWSTYRI